MKRVHLAAGSKLTDNYVLYQTINLYEKYKLSSEPYRKTRKLLKLDKQTGIEIIEGDGGGFQIEN